MTDDEVGDEQRNPGEYEAYRIGRVQATKEVSSLGGSHEIEEGTIRLDLCTRNEAKEAEAIGSWAENYMSPNDTGAGVTVPIEFVGTISLPEPMTAEEADAWLEANPEEARDLLDTEITSDTTAADMLDSLR